MNTIEGYDVKNFTDMVDENAMRQIKQLLSINFFADKKDQDIAGVSIEERKEKRQKEAYPVIKDLETWLYTKVGIIPRNPQWPRR